MSKKICAIAILIIGLLACVAFAHPQKSEEKLYPRAFVITELDYENDLVIVEDATEHIWDFEEIEDWEIGDMVVAIMSDNGTEIMSDDYFVEIRWAGYNFPHNQLEEIQAK